MIDGFDADTDLADTGSFARQAGRTDIVRSLRWSSFHSVLYRRWLRSIMFASYRLQQRSPLYSAIVRRPKRFIQRTGLGRGRLY